MPVTLQKPRILCIGMPVRDLTFGVQAVPGRGQKFHADRFSQICGGNALNAAIGISRLGGRASLAGPLGDKDETSSQYIYDDLANENIDATHLVHMPGLVTPISGIMMTRRASAPSFHFVIRLCGRCACPTPRFYSRIATPS